MTTAERLRVLKALLERVRVDATACGVPSAHCLRALAAHAEAWADELEQ